MSKILYMQDFHLLGKSPENRKDNYLQSMLLKFDEILQIAKKEKVDFILDGGDFLESPIIANTIIDEILDRIEEKKIPFYMLYGNHCEIGHNIENSKGTSLAHMFRRSKYVNYLDIMETEEYYIEGLEYKHNCEQLILDKGLFHNQPKNKLTIAIVHALITEKPLPYSAMHVYYKDIKSNFDYILVAHNHHPFEFNIGNTKILDIGCIGRRKVDEADLIPTVALIDTNLRQIEGIELTSAKKGVEVFNLEKVAQKKLYEGEIDKFIKSLDSTKFQSLDLRGLIELLAKENEIEKEVKDEVIKRIGENE